MTGYLNAAALRGPVLGALALARRVPATMTAVALLWIIGAATGSLLSGPDPALRTAIALNTDVFAAGHWWAPLTSVLWCGNLAGYLTATALLLVLVAPAERRLGARRTLVFLLVSQVIGALIGSGLVKVGSDAGIWWYTVIEEESALGPSIGAVGVGLALSHRLPDLWRRRVRVLMLVVLSMMTLYLGSFEDISRLAGAAVGLLAGSVLLGPSRRWPDVASSRSETRTLVAIVVAASAIGPLLPLITRNAFGPLSELQYLFTSIWVVRADGIGPAITSVVPMLIMVAVAEGLRRGRRFAWWSATVPNLALVALIGFDLADALTSPDSDFAELAGLGGRTAYLMHVAPLILAPLALVTVLLLTRRQFDVAAPPRTYRRFWQLVGMAALLAAAVNVLVGYLIRVEYSPAPGIGQLVADLPIRFIPTGYLFPHTASFQPVGPIASILHDYTGAVFWTVALVGALHTFWRTRPSSGRHDAARARALLVEHGGSSLSYMTMWPGNCYWFSRDGRCAVAYRVAATVALTTGDPLGPPEEHGAAFRGFAEFCRRNGWTACFYSVTERMRDIAAAAGWKALQVAEDTVLPLAELAFTGKKWQDVRTALNNARKQGVVAEWCRYSDAPLAITDQIRAISAEWTANKGLPEMGFTLGGMAELADPEVRCLIAVDADRTVHGIVSWLPVYRDGRPVGWTLDFMRRRAGCFPGTMEFLIASSVQRFREEGAEFLSLSGAPLARLDRGEPAGPAQRMLDFTGRALEPVYGFNSLLAFKAKFQPVYRPLYMIYQDPAALLTIANAVGRAYLPNLTPRQALRLLGKFLAWPRRATRGRPAAAVRHMPKTATEQIARNRPMRGDKAA